MTDAVMRYSGATGSVSAALQPTLDLVDTRAAAVNERVSEVASGLQTAIREAQEARVAAGKDPELDMEDWLKILGGGVGLVTAGAWTHGKVRDGKYVNKSAAADPNSRAA